MSTDGRPPEDRTSGLTGGPSAEAAAETEAGIEAETETEAGQVRGTRERTPRLQALAGLAVRGSDGRVVGRVRDIYQQDASGALAAITVMPRQLSARTVLIPAAAIESLPPTGEEQDVARSDTASRSGAEARSDEGTRSASTSPEQDLAVRLRVDAAAARAGRRPPEIAHVTPQDLREAAEALGLDPDDGTGTDAETRSDREADTDDETGLDREAGTDGWTRSDSSRTGGEAR